MPRGYRSIILALIGWLVLAAANNVQSPQQRNAAEHQQTASQIERAANTIATAIRNSQEPSERDTGCENREDRRNSDLCAQWKAADAAERAANYAGWSILIGVLGSALLLWTLWETRETGRREHRAYVRVEPAPGGSVQPDKNVCLPFNLINYGRTPALDLSLQSAIVVREPDWDWEDEQTAETAQGLRPQIALHPDSPYLVKVEMDDPLPGNVYDAIMAGKAVVFARGTVRYRDVFRKWRETAFQVEFHGEDKGSGTDGKLRIATKGNRFS